MRRRRGGLAWATVALVVASCALGTTPSPTVPTPSPAQSSTTRPSPLPTAEPSAAPTPAPSPTVSPSPAGIAGGAGRPTRVAVPVLGVDLPVVHPVTNSTFPQCDVAEYFAKPTFQHPGAGGVTYIYAHARDGMFLPILEASKRNGGKALKGQAVEVWTAYDRHFRYEIVEVRRHQHSLDWATGLPPNSLVLQTSETPYADGTKVMVVARQVGDPVGATRAESIPRPRPVACR